MILNNHGLLSCGTTIAEAFFNMYMLNRACEMQVFYSNKNLLILIRLLHYLVVEKMYFFF